MLADALLAVGLLFSTFTQFRIPNTPVGIGEVCLLIWLIPTLGSCMSRVNEPLSQPFFRLATFWLLLAASLAVGQMVSVVVGAARSHALLIHDILAYSLAGAISLAAVLQPRAEVRLRRTIVILVSAGSIVLAIQLLQAARVLPELGLDLWFYDRFTGWTTNSNQLALLCLVLAMLWLHLAESASRPLHRALAMAGVVLPAMVGYLTGSDAFLIAVGIAFACYAVIGLRGAVGVLSRPANLQTLSLALLLAGSAGLLLASVPLVYRGVVTAISAEVAITESRQRIDRDLGYRTALLAQAVERGIESGFLGLGPGPHLHRPASLREPKWTPEPDFEAHNTPVDLFLQGGLLSVAALGWLMLASIRETSSASMRAFAILVIVLGVFALTHNIVRHPIVWLVVTCSLVLPPAQVAAAALGRTHRAPLNPEWQ